MRTAAVRAERSVPAFIPPQLCHTLPPGATLAAYRATHICEEKFDGARIVACVLRGVDVEAWSRPRAAVGGGTQPPCPKRLGAAVRAALLRLPDGVYDGEIVVPRIPGAVKGRGRLTDDESAVCHLFDVLEVFGQSTVSLPWTARRGLLEQAVAHTADPVRITKVLPVSQRTVDSVWRRGGEGVLLKDRSSSYEPGYRSHAWLKVKALATAVLTVTGFKAGLTGPYASFVLRNDEGTETTVGSNWNHRTLPPDAYIGRRVQIEFQKRTVSGSYRHPRLDRLVDEEERP
ncbi:MAG: ATP-dependent DNA ligase [Acidobacteria bacterium]|nr:ATP-dependent DNA ligase [Acidobacteriota bacterium]